MAVLEVFSQPELIRYKASVCSKASFVVLFCALITFIPPLLIGYRTGDFWKKTNTYNEQPNIHFKYKLLVTLTLNSPSGDLVTWSTYPNYNQLMMEKLRIPTVKAIENDPNGDGLKDELVFELSMPLADTEQVYGVTLILIFDYVLEQFTYFEMESMGYVSYSSPVAGSVLDLTTNLALHLKSPLGHAGVDTRYNSSIISETSVYAQAFDLPTILHNYMARNVTTELFPLHPVWFANRAASQPFVIKGVVKYPTEYGIVYYTGFWEMIKWGWVQYVSILIIFWYVIDRILIFIFQYRLVTTVVNLSSSKDHFD